MMSAIVTVVAVLGATSTEAQSKVTHELWRAAIEQRREADAARWFGELVRTGFASDADQYEHANFLTRIERYNGAAPIYESLAQNPAQATGQELSLVWYSAAYARWMLGEQDVAMAHAERAIAAARGRPGTNRTIAQAHSVTAHILIAKGDHARALDRARQATAADSSYFWAYTQLARASNLLNQPAEAESAAKKAFDLSNGTDYDAQFELGMAYFAQERWVLAQQSFELVTRLDKTHAYAAYNVAQALSNAGNAKEALPWYEEALRRDPKMRERDSILAAIARIKERKGV